MRFAVWSLRLAPSFRNQSLLLYKTAVHLGFQAEERDLTQPANLKTDRWERTILLAPLWPRYVQDAARLGARWFSRHFSFYGPVDGPLLLNVNFFDIMKSMEIVTTSKWCMEQLTASEVNCKGYVYHAIDPDDFKFDDFQRQNMFKVTRTKYPGAILFFSNLNPLHRKGFNHLARALELLAQDRPEGWVFVLHTGVQKALQIEPGLTKVPNLVLQDAYGHLPFRQIALMTSACDCFVWPSLREGFGEPVLEAMAGARPIICQDIAPMNELVDSSSAFLFPSTDVKFERWDQPGCMAQLNLYDPASLKDAMIYVMDHPKEVGEKAHKAHDRSKDFHYEKVYRDFVRGKF